MAVLLAGLRLLGAAIPPLFPGAPLFDYRLFSLPSFSGLAGSPGEALFTSLAVLAGAALLCRSARGRGAWARAGSFALAAGLVAALAWLTPSWVANCALNLARSPFLAPRAARLALYSAHAALALAAALLALRAFTPRSRPLATRAIAFAWLAATAFSFLLLARGATKVPAALVETSLAPEVVQSGADARAALLGLLEDAARDPRWEALESGSADAIEQLAFDAWRSSDLGGNGMRSAVAVLAADGSVLASFAYGLPESVFRDTPPLRAPVPTATGPARPDEPALGEQHYTVVSLDVPLLRGEIGIDHDGRRVGSFAAIVSGERDNIPFLTLSDPLLRTLGAGRAEPLFEEYFGGAPLFLAWSPSGEVLFPSAERASPLPAGTLPILRAAWTRIRYAGGSYDIYLFPTPDGPRAIGYAARGRTFLAAGLVRAMLAGLPLLLLALLVPPLLHPPARAPIPERAPWTSILTGSYYRRLLAVVLLSSLVPLLLLAAIFRGSIERRTREEFERDGVQAAGTVRRLLEDYVTSRAPAAGAPSPIESWTLFWLGRTIHEDIDLFAGETLAATSRGSLEASGLRTFRLNAEVARALALNRPPQFLSKEPRPGHAETIVYAPVRLRAGAPDGILAVPLILEERGLGRAGEEIADAILTATFGLGLALLGVGYVFTRRLSVPIRELGSASRRIAEGNLDVRVRPRGRDEIRQLVDAFNGMAIALGAQREDLRRRKEYIEAILLNVTTGVISTDAKGIVRTANPAASILLGLPADLEGRSLFAELGEHAELAPVLELWSARPGGPPAAAPREIPLRRDGEEIRLRSVVLPLAEPDGASEGRIYLVEDVTEVMRSNRLAAWAEMARRIAHEIKNPLTPIQLSAEHLLRVRSDRDADYDRVLRECVETILGQVRALREISSDFSAYSRLPDLRREPTDLAALLRGTLAPYRAAPPAGIRFEEDLDPIEPLPLDGRVLRRAFVNLLENALQAMEEGGTLRVTLRRRGEGADAVAEVEVADTGEGIGEAAIERIFEPYFSTRDAGVGLGLAIARRAVEEHGGTIAAESAPGRGTRMIVRLPITPPPR